MSETRCSECSNAQRHEPQSVARVPHHVQRIHTWNLVGCIEMTTGLLIESRCSCKHATSRHVIGSQHSLVQMHMHVLMLWRVLVVLPSHRRLSIPSAPPFSMSARRSARATSITSTAASLSLATSSTHAKQTGVKRARTATSNKKKESAKATSTKR